MSASSSAWRRANDMGATAAARRESYDSNPFRPSSDLRHAWSLGHNGARARIMVEAAQTAG